MKKIAKNQAKALAEIKDRGGAVMSSDWTYGNGRFTTRRNIPPCCEMINRWAYGHLPKRIQKVFDKHPRCHYVVAITDMRSANRAIKEFENV